MVARRTRSPAEPKTAGQANGKAGSKPDGKGDDAADSKPPGPGKQAEEPQTVPQDTNAQQRAGGIEGPNTVTAAPPAPISSLLSQLDSVTPERAMERATELGGGGNASIVSGAQGTVLGSTDVGDLLTNSVFNTGVFSRQISPVITNTRVRGYRYSEIRTTLDGAAWFAVRPDADTPLSRFDSSVVEDVAIIRGPYNVRLGPGFSFIDVSLQKTPRHADGFHVGGDTKFTWDTNGGQWFGRQALHGGGEDRGWRVGYGHRGGTDYEDGNGTPIASGYNIRDWNFAYGLDLAENSSFEFNYIRTDMTDVETPGQVNDFRSLVANGFGMRLDVEDHILFDRLSVNGWYNLSEFQGTLANKRALASDPNFFFAPTNQLFDFRVARVVSAGRTASAGGRVKATLGEAESGTVTFGSDYTLQQQTYIETRLSSGIGEFGVPKGREEDTGIFADGQYPIAESLVLKAGGRIDFVSSNSTPSPGTDGRSLALNPGISLEQAFTLGAGYLSAELELDETTTLTASVGYAERAPSLTDLYGDLPHLSIMQEGAFFLPHGELLLNKERAFQTDLAVAVDYEFFRGGVSGFFAKVNDFITYQVPHLNVGPHLEHAIGVNHDVIMGGGELYSEVDLTDALTAFATLSYVEANDLVLQQPLWGVAPLDSRIGLRLTDTRTEKWGVEYVLRLVNRQNRISTVGFEGELATPGFNTHSIRGYYQMSEGVAFIGGVDNLGDALYREHLDTRLNLTANTDPALGIFRRGVSFYFSLQAEY